MKYNRVTWYSKVIAMVLFIALPFIGFYLGMKYQEGVNPPTMNVVNFTKKPDNSKVVVKTDQLIIKTTYANGTMKYFGTIQFPDACHDLLHEAIVIEPAPEQVQIKIITTLPRSANFCAQVITEKKFSGEVQVSEDATVTVFLNDEKVN